MKILLLGAVGQVGSALRAPLAAYGELISATRGGVLEDGSTCLAADLADRDSLRAVLNEASADLVVNAAAYTAVDRAEDEPELADRVNHLALAEIGAWAAARGARVVHYSTDYVFDGAAQKPYREDDPTAPLGSYGRSKLAGEIALQASGAEYLILRTAWVYASNGQNFLRTMLKLSVRDELRVVADQVGSPTPAHWIAKTTLTMLRRLDAMSPQDRAQAFGTYHLTASSRCSWFDFASAIMREAQAADLIQHVPRVHAITKAEYPTRATRPAFSVLDNVKLALVFGVQLPEWQQGLREVIGEMAAASRLQGETS
jgi:dTDP-4-dehydrorhamnose reductase